MLYWPIIMGFILYQKISFLLLNLSILFGIGGLFIILKDYRYILEWGLGGSLINFSATFFIDYFSCFFICVVFLISCNVVWYSQSYIGEDKDANRFICLVFGFIVAIFFLVLRPNILRILLGWDGLGLISYALVIYYPTKKSRRAGILTVLSNRVGDVCILLMIGWFRVIGDFNFFAWVNLDEWSVILAGLTIVAALTKRAQVPFSAWLPAAIAAPTPVSALVHSSTLVTAGVYLLIRFGEFLGGWHYRLMIISLITIFIAGLVAVYECDFKKVIALSTLRQLAVIMFSISLGLYLVAFFHLIIHALFKAILFLCAGVLIHGVGGRQDIRIYGVLSRSYPIVGSCINLANLSLCGIPFLSGFYSKDIIVELAGQSLFNIFLIIIMFISLGLTVLYSLRLSYLSFINHSLGGPLVSSCDTDSVLVIPIIFLTVSALFSGSLFLWVFFVYTDLVFLPIFLKLGACLVVFGSVCIGCLRVVRGFTGNYGNLILWFVGGMWFLPVLSGQGISRVTSSGGDFVLHIWDQGWLEFLGAGSVSKYTKIRNRLFYCYQLNSLKGFFLIFVVWLILSVCFFIYFCSLNYLKLYTEDVMMENS